jgi:hypothetical protein
MLAASLCLLAACTKAPDLMPRVAYVEIEHQVDQANLIVVGVVEGEQAVRKVAGTKKTGPLELRAVDVRTEGVIKGEFSGDHLRFYYYQMTGGAWDGPAPNIVSPGERGIFYLLTDGGALRATTDAFLSHTRLDTGKHSISTDVNESRVREAIARLVLMPGEGADLGRYLESMHRSESLAIALVDREKVGRMLQSLLSNPTAEIRARACIGLAEFPLNDKGCLQEIIRDDKTPRGDRKRAEEILNRAQ